MEFPFPPPPPGYTVVLTARWLLVTWAVIGGGIVIVRQRQWETIRPREILRWLIAATISGVVATFGVCRFSAWDSNEWVLPAIAAAIFVSVAGIAIGILKLCIEGHGQAIRRGFVVSIFVVVSLAALLNRPSLSSRQASRRTQCKNNIKQLGLALHGYHDVYHSFPPSFSGGEPVSWRVSILPFIYLTSLYEQYDQRSAWDRPPNDKLALEQIEALSCPANYNPQDALGRWFTAYSMPTGPHAVGETPNGAKIRDIADGTSNMLLVVEACGAQIIWTKPHDVDVALQPEGINLKGTSPGNSKGWLSSYHSGGIHVLMADGAVRFISAATDPTVLKKLATIDGFEEIGEF